ncbi:hypothetical protein Tco_0652015 [Tanacetum coccineum]|uniref:Uncharacterized protein n=1 Tax=Tanacetum coccineum TaxID=301880 RepID=A0ABQ4WWD5_9ASTR
MTKAQDQRSHNMKEQFYEQDKDQDSRAQRQHNLNDLTLRFLDNKSQGFVDINIDDIDDIVASNDIDYSDDILDMELELLTSMNVLTMDMMLEDEYQQSITLRFELEKSNVVTPGNFSNIL